MMMAEVHYHLDLVNGNARTILHLDNSYSASACVGKSITGMIPLPVMLFLLSQQILCKSVEAIPIYVEELLLQLTCWVECTT